ncbi:MAG TPA: AbiH family protein [Prolixibacteraceae bacterium]|nr:AbiH family protein [Prolixibacteraceae bacterium]HPR85538.1 AbiH family protein [Prolixibacteraceae bacterium]
MNDLYLIGNGFDLAHGLETSYNDFLLWYLKKSLHICSAKHLFDDQLITVKKGDSFGTGVTNYKTIKEILEDRESGTFSIKYKNDFFEKILESYRDFKWVDIEYEYYMTLVEIYKKLDSGTYLKESIINQLKELNSCFDAIKKRLTEYLLSIEITTKLENRKIEAILLEGTGAEGNNRGEKIYLYFNYTPTIELYARKYLFEKNNWIYIHGGLEDSVNPMIFGYGDEMDPYYDKIENLNSNEFLKNIKSFSYFKTDNYLRVIRFIDSDDFTVKILGHSCGLSDRILLNTIFEHPNCKHIKIYYYQKSETENDYFEKTQEISRHFKASMKSEMRKKIVPFEESIPLPQNPKDN